MTPKQTPAANRSPAPVASTTARPRSRRATSMRPPRPIATMAPSAPRVTTTMETRPAERLERVGDARPAAGQGERLSLVRQRARRRCSATSAASASRWRSTTMGRAEAERDRRPRRPGVAATIRSTTAGALGEVEQVAVEVDEPGPGDELVTSMPVRSSRPPTPSAVAIVRSASGVTTTKQRPVRRRLPARRRGTAEDGVTPAASRSARVLVARARRSPTAPMKIGAAAEARRHRPRCSSPSRPGTWRPAPTTPPMPTVVGMSTRVMPAGRGRARRAAPPRRRRGSP